MNITNDMINPEIRRMGILMRRLLNFKSRKTIVRAQRLMPIARRFMKPRDLDFRQRMISTPDNPQLRLCEYRSLSPQPNAVGLLWIHGGGYATGAPEQDVRFIRNFIGAANCVVLSPDYRLSVDAPYPAAVNDCYQALLWMKENAAALGIRDDQLFVGGDSAGGGLAAAVSLMARDTGEVNIAFLMPLYPMLDDRMITASAQNNDAPVWNTQANEVAWQMYLGDLYGTKAVPAYAAPGRETDHRGLPPMYTYVGSIEPFRDETKAYIAALQKAGVQADMDVYDGCFHGFDIICPKSQIARQATGKCLERFQYAVEHYFAPQSV